MVQSIFEKAHEIALKLIQSAPKGIAPDQVAEAVNTTFTVARQAGKNAIEPQYGVDQFDLPIKVNVGEIEADIAKWESIASDNLLPEEIKLAKSEAKRLRQRLTDYTDSL